MKDKHIILLCVIILFVLLGIQQYFIRQSEEDVLLKKIEELELKIDSLSSKKDSIRIVIKTIDKNIQNNEKHYEKVVTTIINQSSSADSIFARDYIKKFIDERLSDD